MAVATKAYVTTFLGGDQGERCLEDVVRLTEGLRKAGSAYPLVVAVPADVPEEHRRDLASLACIVRELDPVCAPPEKEKATQLVATALARFCSKLGIWKFVEYERIVYLDAAEVEVFDNIDELFELETGHFYALKNCNYYCQQQCPDPDKVALPTSELRPPTPAPYFNPVVFVHEPSKATAEALLNGLHAAPPVTPFITEQDFLNNFFKDDYKPIPAEFNVKLFKDPENELVVDKATKADRLKGEKYGSWLAATTAFARQNPPAMATLAASSAALGVVTNTANPAISFAFYAAFLATIATVTLSLRGM